MSDSRFVPIKNLIEVRKGRQPKNILSFKASDSHEPYILIENFNGKYTAYTNDANAVRVSESDVIVVWDGERAGLSSMGHRGYLGSTLSALTPKEKLDPQYLFYNLVFNQKNLRNLAEGTGVPHLSRTSIDELTILELRTDQQQKIAEILTSVDEVIENTQSQINKLEDLKKATMNELLTKGIGHTEFKETEIGRIPKSWEVFEIKNYLQSIKSGLSRNLSMSDIGLPVMNSGNIQNSTLERSQLKFWYEKDPQGSRTEDYYLNDGDLLLNFINSEKQIGKCCIYKQNGRREIFTTNLFRLRSNESTSPEFLHLLIINDRFQREMQIITKPAVNQASFTREEFLALKVPKVARDEQKLIVDASEKLIKYQFEVNKKLDCLLFIKRSLMQDLLTGKVRVTVN
jgi:type I restriction enzyme S subunit